MRLFRHAARGGGVFAVLSLFLAIVLALAGGTVTSTATPAQASTNVMSTSDFRGVNWADQRDNFVNGVLYVSGLSSSDTYSSAATVADRVLGQMYSVSGANTVRIPINEPTVSQYWGTYTGAIDMALTKGKVIFAYWAYTRVGRPESMTAFNQMWDRVIAKYSSHPNAYFEVINEPGMGPSDLNNFYNTWLNRHPGVPRGRVVLDGSSVGKYANTVGDDSRLNGTLISVHDYAFYEKYDSETQWENHLASFIGRYASRVIVTEWGSNMRPHTYDGVYFDAIDYNIPSGSYFADYMRAMTRKMRELGVGNVYWPGLRDGDAYSMFQRTGSGANTNMSVVNRSGLDQLRYSWGLGDEGSTTVKIRNIGTSLYVDGQGRTTNGSAAGQSSSSASLNQEWVVENVGNYVRFKNVATGRYLDGMGRTANGSAAGQWASSTSSNQQWSVVTGSPNGNNVRIRNRATGLYLDGMGRTTNGADLGQASGSTSSNQQWRIVPGTDDTPPQPEPQRYEAETSPAVCQGTIDSNHAGFSGSGFCNGTNAVGAYSQFVVNASAAGTTTLAIRFANGAGARLANLVVNGATAATVSFEGTGAWTMWSTKTQTVLLNAGSNTIRLDPTTADGLPNVDAIDVG